MHTNSVLLFQKYAARCLSKERAVLEIGPDAFPSSYEVLSRGSFSKWDTLDLLDDKRLTYPNSAEYRFLIPDDSYDVVIAGQVIEHVRKPWLWVREVSRVCKQGGYLVLINPISWPYHKAPIDCWRIYPEGIEALLEDTRFEIAVSTFESLEVQGYRRYTPGMSPESQHPLLRFFFRLFGPFGFPVERSYDCVTIARKS